ncbi:MAG: YfhO family protein [Chloroflexi bacterium]|nr:YfhO family protein [Chloroflexota bacterium]
MNASNVEGPLTVLKPDRRRVTRLAPLVVFALFPTALLWRAILAGEAFYWGPPLLQFVPWQKLAAEYWRNGQLPLWNPWVGCGAPLAANYQSAAFYPLNALALFVPAEIALSWTTLFHLGLGGWGIYCWARAVGLRQFPALLGGLTFCGSGFVVARVALFPSIGFTFPWVSVWLWRAEVLAQRARCGDVVWLGAVLGLGLLAGHAQTAFYGAVLVAAYYTFRILQKPTVRGQASRILWQVAMLTISVIAGVCIAAVQLVPTAQLMRYSQRANGVNYDLAMTYSFWPWRLLTLFAPDLFGNPSRGDFWGYATYWEDAGYIGLLPLLLALSLVVSVLRRCSIPEGSTPGSGQVGFWVGGAAISILLAMGIYTPVFPFLFRYVPTFNLFQSPARWLAVTTVGLSALAALGADAWPEGIRGRRRATRWTIVGVSLALGGIAAPFLVPEIVPTFGPATLRLGLTLSGAGLVMHLRPQPSDGRAGELSLKWSVVALGFVAVDLLLFGWPLVPTVDRSLYGGQTQVAGMLRESADSPRIYWPSDPTHLDSQFDALQRAQFSYLTFDDFGSRDAAHWWEMREALIPNLGMLDRVAAVNNYEPLQVRWYNDVMSAIVRNPGALRVTGATHVVGDWPGVGGETVWASGPQVVSRLTHSLGRAWVVSVARAVTPEDALGILQADGFDPAQEVLLIQTNAEAVDASLTAPVNYSLSLQDNPNGVTIRAVLDRPGYLVVADTWYPGWVVTVDNHPAELLRANVAFRAVRLDSGQHTVEMTYRPAVVYVGGAITLVSLVVSVAVLLATSGGRRQ